VSEPERPKSDVSTLRDFGALSLAQTALGIARGRLGEAETPGRPNEGPIVDWCLEGLTRIPAAGRGRYKAGWAKWCAYFVLQCVRQALLQLGPSGALLLLEWQAIAAGAGDADVLWDHLEARRCTWLRGEGAPEPGPGCIVFFGTPGKIRHVAFVERVAGGHLLFTVEGNHGDRVAEDSYNLADQTCDVFGYGRLPF
jgi:hypothetical protein